MHVVNIDNTEYHDDQLEPELTNTPEPEPHTEDKELNALRMIAGIPGKYPKTTDPELIQMQRIARIPGK